MDLDYCDVKKMWEERVKTERYEKISRVRATFVISFVYFLIVFPLAFIKHNITYNVSEFMLLLVLITGCTLIHVITHELGHFIGGLMTGYRFLLLRIFCFQLYKVKGKMKFKLQLGRFAGQCLMAPPKNYTVKSPYLIYNSFGLVVNLIVSIIAFTIYLASDNPSTVYISYWLFITGILFLLINGIPLAKYHIINDGLNIHDMRLDEGLRMAAFQQLDVFAKLCDGKEFSAFTTEELMVAEPIDDAHHIANYLWKIRYFKYLDEHDYDLAKRMLDEMEKQYDDMIIFDRYFIDVERLFFLMYEGNDIKVTKTYYKYLRKKMKYAGKSPCSLRVRILYALWIHQDEKEAAGPIRFLGYLTRHSMIPQEAKLQVKILTTLLEEKQMVS